MTYRIVWIHEYNGTRGILFDGPLTHEEACTCLFKVTKHPWRRVQIERI